MRLYQIITVQNLLNVLTRYKWDAVRAYAGMHEIIHPGKPFPDFIRVDRLETVHCDLYHLFSLRIGILLLEDITALIEGGQLQVVPLGWLSFDHAFVLLENAA